MIHLRVDDESLDFWVDLRLRQFGSAWLAVADLSSEPEIGTAARPDLAAFIALWPLGPELAARLAAQVARNVEDR